MTVMLDHAAMADTVGKFLDEAIRLHRGLCTIHSHESNDTVSVVLPRLRDVSTVLDEIVQPLGHYTQSANDSSALDSLATACHRVGRDLLVHLERIHPAKIDQIELLTVWPLADVAALGVRLQELKLQWSSVASVYFPDDSLVQELSRLTIESVTLESSLGSGPGQDASTTGESIKPDQAQSKPKKSNVVSNETLEDFILEELAFSSMRDREEEVTAAHRRTFEWVYGEKQKSREGTDFGSEFARWLSTGEMGSIYWITGKPGSGKSTLTRFLFDNPFTKNYLASWSLGRPVAMASFYFWTSGSHEQKSQTGLLRYLLHQLLSSDRSLIPHTFPALWGSLLAMSTKERIRLSLDWTASELMTAFQACMDIALESLNICLFIDGLDEFEGDHKMIINFFKDLVNGSNGDKIKLCLSSRPWPVFEAAFEHSVPNLKLQDLTYGDMHRYAEDRLTHELPKGCVATISTVAVGNIADEAVRKADGVFLWIRLAVNQMLDDAKQDADVSGLRATLHGLPGDLDDLFEHLIFLQKTEQQLAETATIFQLIRARELVSDFIKDESAHSLTVWELGFAFEKSDNEVAMSGRLELMNDEAIQRRLLATGEYLQRGFSKLLDVYTRRDPRPTKVQILGVRQLTEGKINFIHRTVRDWLLGPQDVESRLNKRCPAGFDPHLYLLRSYVVRMKRPLAEPERHRRLDEWWPDIALAMSHARYVTRDPDNLLRPFMNELNNTIGLYWVTRPRDPEDHWAKHAFGSYEVRMKAPPIKEPFLCLSTKFGITQYIREELDALDSSAVSSASNDPQNQIDEDEMEAEPPQGPPPLSYATEFLCSRKKTIYPLSDPELVEYLLRASCKNKNGPNSPYADFVTKMPLTPWLAVLRHLRDARRRGWIEYYDVDPMGTPRWSEVVRLFLKHGADAKAIVLKDMWDPEISAIGVLQLLEETYGSAEVKEIRESMEEMARRD